MNKKVNDVSFLSKKKEFNFLLIIMRVFILSLCFGLTSVYAHNSYSQTKLDIDLKNGTLEELFGQIHSQSEFIFFYKDDIVKTNTKITLLLKQSTIAEILNKVFQKTDLAYKIIDRQIVISKQKKELNAKTSSKPKLPLQDILTGKVTTAIGEPLPGASIIIKGTNRGTQTDFDGYYKLEVTNGESLVFSYLGFSNQEVIYSGQPKLDITLIEDAGELGEVIVVGYGTRAKSLITGAISSIGFKQIENSSNQRMEQVLQGRVSGVTVVSSSGAPGSGAKVRIRGTGSNGNSDPLYIVDGMKVSNLENIAPSDIANIEVLKDAASSAIYGTQGANGVVIITTKQGRKGQPVINYNSQVGIQTLRTKMELMNASQFVTYSNEAGNTTVVNNGIDTDWIGETFQDAFIQKHDLSFSGGSERSTYFLSGSFLDQDGIVGKNNSSYKRYTLRANLKSDIKDWLEVGANIVYSNTGQAPITEDDSYNGVVNHVLLIDPLTPVTYNGSLPPRALTGVENGTAMLDQNGNVYGYPTYSTGEVINPVASSNYIFRGGIDTDRVLLSVKGKIKLSDDLSFTSRFGYERSNSFDTRWTPIYYVTSEASNSIVTLKHAISRNSRWLWENFARYNKNLGDHSLTGLLGYSAEKIKNPYYNLQGAGITRGTDDFAYFDFSNRDNDIIGNNIFQKNMTSVFGRISYDYLDKYLLEGSLRYDKSSVFPKNEKGGYFPAVSVGWVLSKENFWNSNKINYIKLRGSWGQNGSDANLSGNGDLEFWQNVVTDVGVIPIVYEGISGTQIGDLANPQLLWERSEQVDIGIDLKALDNKFNFSVDYYNKTTRDLIVSNGNIIVPGSVGRTLGAINAGTITNKGFEFEIGYNTTTSGGLDYGINLNLSTLKNNTSEVSIGGALNGASIPGAPITRFEEGFPVWYFYGFKTDGIDPQTGEIIFVDTDGVPGITSNDKTMIGSPHPDILFGGNISLGYKNFDLNVLLQGTYGNDIFAGYHQPSRPITNKPIDYYNNRWQQPGDIASFPGAANIADAYNTDLMVEDGSYMRIKQLQIGYNFPLKITNKLSLGKFRVYVSLDDYFTFTKYNGLDPEAGSYENNSQGIDRGFYPIPGKALFGLSVGF
ncbi:TonB-linked SusC/RagA family outer membrane protein [Aquimarina sp. MAR_2010_214]|uniref:TonB-dependent receptor n=1 Tax=Aquimarina sp. MAR_2010_214 TaxID=1250026 RepID=UPI000C713273|nr:TonB-dependent receptor [Aquimarina sp. MAR_2010_214]PKV52904.1 TonB-linked SusC/RagA family outer membrane protein [Aquimarina sp. MAR_2010_214]